MPSLLEGFASIFDFTGSLNTYDFEERSEAEAMAADIAALRSDWEKVAHDDLKVARSPTIARRLRYPR